jgi:diguanylate cyclase (GGDEF)-like protein
VSHFIFRFLTPPSTPLPETTQRRARVLSFILLTLIFLLVATLIEVISVTPVFDNRRKIYVGLISALLVILCIAYFLNRTGHYAPAAHLTVLCGLLGPWGAVLLDRFIIQGDYIPLIYMSLSLFLSAILLSVRFTVVISTVQFIALLTLSVIIHPVVPINWPSLLTSIFFTSVISVVSTMLNQQDIQQIEKQNELLAQHEAELKELSVRDPLTGLYNRRFMEAILDKELVLAKQKQVPLSVVMIDIDQFKHFNDTYGHVEGDVLLRLLGAVLRTHIRKSDVVCRFGGDEFVLIMPGAFRDAAYVRAEILREEVRQIQEENRDQIPEIVTISLGIASFPSHGECRETLLRTADATLYQAKQAGRDRVVVAV